MSWAFLVYAIDVLSTDGIYRGWMLFLILSVLAYSVLWWARLYDQEATKKKVVTFHSGKVFTLEKEFDTLSIGEKIVVVERDHSERVKVRYPDGNISGWIRTHSLEQVVAPDSDKAVFVDYFKPLRRIVVGFGIVCVLGIGYANFMPTKDTAYKMLAAYVGQTVVETPQVRETAGNAIDFLNKAIKKYSAELDEDESAKAKKQEKK